MDLTENVKYNRMVTHKYTVIFQKHKIQPYSSHTMYGCIKEMRNITVQRPFRVRLQKENTKYSRTTIIQRTVTK